MYVDTQVFEESPYGYGPTWYPQITWRAMYDIPSRCSMQSSI